METEELLQRIAKILSDKKCKEIVWIDVTAKTDATEAFLLCSARNPSLAKAAYEEICAKLEPEDVYTRNVDGLKDGRWIVMDYGKVIVHIFNHSIRDLYQFEALWSNDDGSNVTRYEEE